MQQGIIVKSIGGLYFTESSDTVYECKARGVFRNKGIIPCVGDIAEFENGVITRILPRKNHIIRPPLANLDQLIFVTSVTQPAPNLLILDKFIAVAEYQNIEPVIVLTKIDLESCDNIFDIYQRAGIQVYVIDYENDDPAEQIRQLLRDKISAFTGNSGAGKSTLLNEVCGDFNIPTGEISQKLGRGKHTTRHSELFRLEKDSYILDTPGFTALEPEAMEKEELRFHYPEFAEYEGACRFQGCVHVHEPGCVVKQAVEEGKIHSQRYQNYVSFYEELKEQEKRRY